MIYLDNNSTTQVDKRVLNKMLPYFSIKYINPHSQKTRHSLGVIEDIEKSREEIANLIGANKEEVIFTSGATESNNLAIKGMMLKIRRGKNHFISFNTEHKCVLEALRKIELEGAKVTILKVKKDGLINLLDLKKAISKKTVMVSVMMANNETGVIQPIEEIGNICKKNNILLHTDAAQAVGKININVKKMNIDFNRLNELTKRYRASLSNLNENEQSLYELILRNYDYLDEDAYFYTLNTERLVTASNQTQQIKDLQALTYYNHKLLNDLKF